MNFKWREGMNVEVKVMVIAMMTSLSAPDLLDEQFVCLKYSQFFKVCVNKYGSKSHNIEQAFKNQQHFYEAILQLKCREMYPCISQFVFGFKIQNQKPPSEMIYIKSYPENADTIQQFKKRVDQYLEERTKNNMINLYRKYSHKNVVNLKVQFDKLQKQECENEQAYNSNLKKWQWLVVQAMNFNCFYQILTDINTTYKNITEFKSNLSKKVIVLHSNKVLENLYNYSLNHKETEYN